MMAAPRGSPPNGSGPRPAIEGADSFCYNDDQPSAPQQPRVPLRTSCTPDGDCPDCGGTGAIGLQPCDRRHQWLRRVGYGQLFHGRAA